MINHQERQQEFLEKCVRDYKIMIDTSSFLQEGTEKFLMNIVPILQREQKSLIVPYSVYLELKKLAENKEYCLKKYPNNPGLNRLAFNACNNIARLQKAKLVAVYADPDDGNFADNVFISVLTRKRLQYSFCLITQDKALASEALKLGKDSGAVKGVKGVIVQRINREGFLSLVFDNRDNNREDRRENNRDRFDDPESDSADIPLNEKFAFATKAVNIEGKMPVSKIPSTGDQVTAVRNNNRAELRLLERIGGGGEGDVYRTDRSENIVAKIYKADKITNLRHEKLKLMLTKDIDCEGVCFPLALLYNQRNEFVGYLMRAAKGEELLRSVFITPLLKKNFPHWTKRDTVQLCVTILRKLKYLHDRNVILGDINPRNILVVSPTEVYFVDTDSWQVEGFICPVGMPTFTAPELIKKKTYDLRSIGNENFAVATLLFMIMLPGKPPYAMQGGEGISDNILKGDFSYPLGERKTGKAPEGPWRFCWSHLPYKIKEAFYETFRYDGVHHDEDKRYGSGYWLRQFENYLDLLKSGKMAAQDGESIKLFPSRFKHQINKTYASCKLCGREFDEERLEQGICRDCLNKGETYRCADCGCEMLYTNYQKYVKHARRHKFCRNCHDKRNMVYEHRQCVDCGLMFEITNGEKESFESKGMLLPKRCPTCRLNKRTQPSFVPRPHPTSSLPPHDTPTTPQKSGGIFDFFKSIFGRN